MRGFFFLIVLLSCFVSGCNKEEISEPYFVWDGQIYITTHEPINVDELSEEVGKIEESVSNPVKDGQANGLPEDTALFMVEGKHLGTDETLDGIIAFQRGEKFNIARQLVPDLKEEYIE